MAEKITSQQVFENLAKSLPVLPILSDHPLDEVNEYYDLFNLPYHLGPVFYILRRGGFKLIHALFKSADAFQQRVCIYQLGFIY